MRPEYTVVVPGFGIAEGCTVQPPDEGLPLWLAAIRLVQDEPDQGSYSAAVVGAAGLTRGSAWVRGVGEAVERYALAPIRSAHDAGVTADLPDVTGELRADGVVGALPEGVALTPAIRLATGEPCAVPLAAVDYPGVPDGGQTDQTPSGAASGLDADRATTRAILELIERDAFERAWQGVTTPHRTDLGTVSDGADPSTREALATLQGIGRRHGHEIRLGVLPTITGVPAVTALVQRDGGPVGVGCSAGESIGACAAKAAIEGIQVESLLRNWRTAEGGAPRDVTPRPRTEAERISYLGTGSATRAADDFAGSFIPDPPDPPEPPPATSAALAGQLAERGVQLFVVDLTHRLPDGVRGLGWRAVRVLPAGLQPLRGNDQLAWNWAHGRMNGRAGLPGVPTRPPHPLA